MIRFMRDTLLEPFTVSLTHIYGLDLKSNIGGKRNAESTILINHVKNRVRQVLY